MNYAFPAIGNISDVLPHIEGRAEFIVAKREHYTVVLYRVNFAETFAWDESDPIGCAIRRECRGLLFCNKTGRVLSRPYHKFFNVGEREETQLSQVDLSQPHVVLQKLDGSMVRPVLVGEGVRLATKAGITDVSMHAEVWVAARPRYVEFCNVCMDVEITPIFEWCSRQDRVVIDYPEEKLILTGMRMNNTGAYIEIGVLRSLAKVYGIKVVEAYPSWGPNIAKIVNDVRHWTADEGVVIRFETGHMVKIKADDYVLLHKTKDAIRQEKNIIRCVIEDSVDDLLPVLAQEDANRLKEFQHAFWLGLELVESELVDLYLRDGVSIGNAKDFAVWVQQQDKYLQSFLYGLRRGKNIREQFLNTIAKSLNSQSQVDSVRWIWGNCDWNYNPQND